MSGEIAYVVGDATSPNGAGAKIIAHVCNDIGGWGKGFVGAISKRWKEPEKRYRKWFAERESNDFQLGAVQFVDTDNGIVVANMVAQRGIRTKNVQKPIRYDALETCLTITAEKALEISATLHMPRIGCGLAGGEWHEIEPIIQRTLTPRGLNVTIYDFGGVS